MFNVVPPKKRDESVKDMSQMYERLESLNPGKAKDEFDASEATYVIYSHKKFGVIGGVRLIPAGAKAVSGDFMKRIKLDPKNKVFEISRIFFDIPKCDKVNESEAMIELIKTDFYLGLYEALKTISISQKVRAFVSVLPEDMHKTVIQYGLWSFHKQAKMASPFKDNTPYILGIMPMSETNYEAFLERRAQRELRNRKESH